MQVIFILALILFSIVSVPAHNSKSGLKIEGSVIGYDKYVALFSLTNAPILELLIIKINKIKKGKEKARYVLATYAHFYGTSFPDKFLDAKLNWKFELMRVKECDKKLNDIYFMAESHDKDNSGRTRIFRMELNDGVKKEDIALDSKMPCYSLADNFKEVKDK